MFSEVDANSADAIFYVLFGLFGAEYYLYVLLGENYEKRIYAK